jgi:hypothetical protein
MSERILARDLTAGMTVSVHGGTPTVVRTVDLEEITNGWVWLDLGEGASRWSARLGIHETVTAVTTNQTGATS